MARNGPPNLVPGFGSQVSNWLAPPERNSTSNCLRCGDAAPADGAKAETEGAQLANDGSLASLDQLLKAQHLDCDWLLKYFQTRQEARQQEMDAIGDAKAVLSGANFGK